MLKRISLFFAFLLAVIMLIPGAGYAQGYTIHATGSYVIGDRDNMQTAKNHAIKEAKRMAVDKAGVYVESYSKSVNGSITEDVASYIASKVIRYDKNSIDGYVSDDGSRYIVRITCYVDTSDIDKYLSDYADADEDYEDMPEVTALVLDYSDFADNKGRILRLDTSNKIKAEDGSIIYDHSYCPGRRGDLCYQDWDYDRIQYKAGEHPLLIKPIFFELSGSGMYWNNPVISNKDAARIRKLDEKYQFLEKHNVFIWLP